MKKKFFGEVFLVLFLLLILVYAGAIVVLLLFVVMMLDIKITKSEKNFLIYLLMEVFFTF